MVVCARTVPSRGGQAGGKRLVNFCFSRVEPSVGECSYENSSGGCTKDHTCSSCGGDHSATSCPSFDRKKARDANQKRKKQVREQAKGR